MSSARIGPPRRALGPKRGQCPASDSRNNSESTVRRPGKAPEGAVPSPSPGRHATTRSRRGSSSSSSPTADGFGTGDPRAQPSEPSFPEVTDPFCDLPCLHCSIDQRLFTLGDLIGMSNDRARTALGPPDFQGPPGAHRTPRDVRCSSSRWTLLRLSRFQGGQVLNRKVTLPRPPPTSPDSLTLPSAAASRSAPTAAPPGSRPGCCSDRRALLLIGAWLLPRRPVSAQLGTVTRFRFIRIASLLTKMAHLGALDSLRGLNGAAAPSTYLKFENRSRRCAPDASNHWLYPIEPRARAPAILRKLRREPATRRFD
ncbi:hypothetical protein Sango_0815800 [Sesamum angolense]|uniref:Uncharacterized protein n=1 Tax=Sesamum angolense TaxID=2727404 RepID=A0AAE1X490_9LAMI|nr:hypothetical protein Sango_0815800 [Sesamum angolense]